jgi:predicted RND superfamily exporter protein
MGWLGMSLNPANLIALPLVLGIGIDSGVHVLHEYRSQTGTYAISRQLLRGLYLTGLANIVGFASLMIGKHHGVVSIGQTLTIGITACELAAIFILPSILCFMTRNAEESPAILELPASASRQMAA